MKQITATFFALFTAYCSFGQTTLDDFTDGDYTSSPVWTVHTGSVSVISNQLVTAGGTNAVSMSTPFTSSAQEWGLTIKSSSSFNDDQIRYFFILKDNADPTNAAADGYYLDYEGDTGDWRLYRMDNGVSTLLGSYNGSGSSSTKTVVITLNGSGDFEVFIDGTSRITATDATYPSSSVQYQAFEIVELDNGGSYTYTIDDIYYISACGDPTDGGVIANAQVNCGSFDPTNLTSTTSASGENGTLEYKWQSSTTTDSTGFSDIAATNSATYDPSTISQTTWFRRLARVDCSAGWTGAAISNVIEITIDAPVSISGGPVNDTIYDATGNASFGLATTVVNGMSYQWLVSTDGGSSWSNVSDNAIYSGSNDTILHLTDPTLGMDGYLYSASATNSCGADTSNSATLRVINSTTTTFSNTTSTACGTDLGNGYTFQRNIVVSGLPTNLGTASGEYVLKQVNLQLGNSSCSGDLSTYGARLRSPSGTTIQLFNNFSTQSTNQWFDIQYRDHAALEKVSEYDATVQGTFYPYSIGFYAPETDGSFFTVNGEDPNGTWVLEIAENTDLTNDGGGDDEVSFEKVELIFGPQFTYTDLTGSSANDDCSGVECIGPQEIIIGTNDGYSSGDSNFPGTTPGGSCNWNGTDNNSAWFSFIASSTSAYLTINGLMDESGSTGSTDMQPIVLSNTSGDCSSGTWDVPSGGCPDDEATNNASYLTTNGGGVTSGNVYFNGVTANVEYNLTGLTAGEKYFINIDGNGASSVADFYIDVESGCQTCVTPLPVELISFTGFKQNEGNSLTWVTASEKNNDYYQVERSYDGYSYTAIGYVTGAGNSNSTLSYDYLDDYYSRSVSIVYYRLKQVDFDGSYEYSKVIAIKNKDYDNGKMISIYPNPTNNNITIVGSIDELNEVLIINSIGQNVTRYTKTKKENETKIYVDLSALNSGMYLIKTKSTSTRVNKL